MKNPRTRKPLKPHRIVWVGVDKRGGPVLAYSIAEIKRRGKDWAQGHLFKYRLVTPGTF